MKNLTVVGIDIGKEGALCSINTTNKTINIFPMPLVKLLKKKAVMKKSKVKGKVRSVIKTPAKYYNVLHSIYIHNFFVANKPNIIYMEDAGITRGNRSSSTKTTMVNLGILTGIAELHLSQVIFGEYDDSYLDSLILVPPTKWKKDLLLSKDKRDSIDLAKVLLKGKYKQYTLKYLGETIPKENIESIFYTPRGKLLDGNAEAFLIAHYGILRSSNE